MCSGLCECNFICRCRSIHECYRGIESYKVRGEILCIYFIVRLDLYIIFTEQFALQNNKVGSFLKFHSLYIKSF